jgi:hypothetical protein
MRTQAAEAATDVPLGRVTPLESVTGWRILRFTVTCKDGYITPLREEIAKVFAQNDAATKQSLSKLSKLDSFKQRPTFL